MKKPVVKFSDVKFKKLDKEATLPAKFQRMLKKIQLDRIVDGRTVALKMHLGGGLGFGVLAGLFVQPRVLDRHGDLVGQGLYHQCVVLVESVELRALDIEHPHDLPTHPDGHV